jgi:hypothetical protein
MASPSLFSYIIDRSRLELTARDVVSPARQCHLTNVLASPGGRRRVLSHFDVSGLLA